MNAERGSYVIKMNMLFSWAGSVLLSAVALVLALNGNASALTVHGSTVSTARTAGSSVHARPAAQIFHAHAHTGPRLTRAVRFEQAINPGREVVDAHLFRLGRSVLAGVLLGALIFGWGYSGRSPPSLSKKLF